MRRVLILCLLAVISGRAFCQFDSSSGVGRHARVYTIRPAVDIPLVVGGAALDLYNFGQISTKNSTSLARLQSLKISDLDWFDRWAVHPYSHSIDQLSYVPFYVAIPLPLIVLVSTPGCGRIFGSSPISTVRP